MSIFLLLMLQLLFSPANSAMRERLADEITSVSAEHSHTSRKGGYAASYAIDLNLETYSTTAANSDREVWIKFTLHQVHCVARVVWYGSPDTTWTCSQTDCSNCEGIHYCKDFSLTVSYDEGTDPRDLPTVADCKYGNSVKIRSRLDGFGAGEIAIIGKQVPKCTILDSTWKNVVTKPALPIQLAVVITLTCSAGHVNKGGNKATCQNGQVVPTNTPPLCSYVVDQSKCSAPTINGGTVSPNTAISPGASYSVTCIRRGSTIKGSDTINCVDNDGQATLSALPTCEQDCADNSQYAAQCGDLASDGYCDTDSEYYEEMSIYCAGSCGFCEVEEGASCSKPDIQDGAVDPDSSTISSGNNYEVTCNGGFIISESSRSTVTCTKGELSALPTCEPDTEQPLFALVDSDGSYIKGEHLGLLLYQGGTVCGLNYFGNTAANVICKHMGYTDAKEWTTDNQSFEIQNNYKINLDDVSCSTSKPEWKSCRISRNPDDDCSKVVFLSCKLKD